MQQHPNGTIIILSYPDTIVRPAYWEKITKFLPKIGVGSKHAVQAGHAALLLLKKNCSEINYYDFGRYITSYGNGRVRCKETDPELVVPIKALFENNKLINLKEILLWLEKHPEKTHGEGRLVASANHEVNFEKANNYINSLICKKEIPYGAFIKNASNCARFVTDTLIASVIDKKTIKRLKKSTLITPSPLGNVLKASSDNLIFSVYLQKTEKYKNRSLAKEYKSTFLKKLDITPNLIGTEKPNLNLFNPKNGTWLGGIGSGAWFMIEEKLGKNIYRIARYSFSGIKDFEGLFETTDTNFCMHKEYSFVHPTSCVEAIILQRNQLVKLHVIK
ncbi:DUF6695 family protein [Polaribacter tangerinus]|uniref:DUF6695 family protein n=1 Tax=Polaribacter tangerinus TaxID=1920034 RepID=UPI000B4B841F|nr:DUF6695 family protein [Polaribacter tangerinus]